MFPERLHDHGSGSTADEGATAVEYAILASAIGAIVVAIVLVIGGQTAALFASLMERWPG